ncbi:MULTISPECIES: branched-chain amino acid ABC transporter permease [unclassified Chelatococcus]|uniref:branched-chain amino acid ABC transporter permease n=1 Tax=unclassified Chelatococcus TaxID=2638111 RepID=UPI001BD042B9|nr:MULTISPECIES: branched-chain amino acid ABC transporter permease [unclassified Chelatococcus]CAH1651188.1 Amino acid/amide ABC transporter membrane protein 1 (HAAT family) [Hyphomicrobiales bacterium]MBS7739824.1 branched-chain amino acid ABC transporter permease [Chelatococcus sp. HY11]MBX3545468.1 branched-chain amino acid ABC transporter permease [Chelatococcus sp.]MCO5078877.1 branched-chain amino acid ABC transporter permease [Chelatococcus sp.]CAH1686346.1 Amino acid/amide ABC transpo
MLESIAQQAFNGFSAGMSYALIALGLTLVFGVLHIINFAHGEFYMLGGFGVVLATTMLGAPYIIAVPLGMIAAIAVAFLVDTVTVRPVLQRRDGGNSALIGTYAASILILEAVLYTYGPAPRRIDGVIGALHIGDVVITYQRILVIVGGFILLALIHMLLKYTSLGRDLRAVAQDNFAARVIGIDVKRVRTTTFLLAAGVAGIAGALMVPISLFTPYIGQHVVIKAFVVVVIGGMGSVVGAVVAGIGIGFLEIFLRGFVIDGIAQAILMSLLIVTLLVRPQGLFKAR